VAGPGGPASATVLRSDPPVVLRPAQDAVHLAQAAAGPLGGDDLRLDVEVPAGRSLRLRAVAATLALPSRCARPARVVLDARLGEGARLEVLLEPVVVADGASLELVTRLDLAAGARLLWREEVVLGRYGERGGQVTTRVDVTYAGRPLLRTGTALRGGDPVTHGPSVLGPHRAVGSLLAVGLGSAGRRPEASSAELSLPGPGTLFTAVAHSALTLRRHLDGYVRELPGGPAAARPEPRPEVPAEFRAEPRADARGEVSAEAGGEAAGADQPRRSPSQSRNVRA
jgi:urease accessory protein